MVAGGVLLAFIGVALLTPVLSRPVVGLLGRIFAWSVPGKLGRLNSGRNPRRTAITAAALMVGIALVTGVGVIVSSAKTSITGAVKSTNAQLIIQGAQTGPRAADVRRRRWSTRPRPYPASATWWAWPATWPRSTASSSSSRP